MKKYTDQLRDVINSVHRDQKLELMANEHPEIIANKIQKLKQVKSIISDAIGLISNLEEED